MVADVRYLSTSLICRVGRANAFTRTLLATKRLLKAIVKGPKNYSDEVKGKLDEVSKISQKFTEQANICLYTRVSEIHQEVEANINVLESINLQVGQTASDVEYGAKAVNHIQELLEGFAGLAEPIPAL